ncbi:uncharacterized protein CG43867-like isoform X1 [Argiope bruennichi]|uniref:uncharacterized protein CG43867-like isoform X1 n=2 Tax=Argiope bruennichi TaxID=94029 RepID=UPI0024951646|nr:uncharacterized protein CG43867-like isoform X1 [Argiope bruennichi]
MTDPTELARYGPLDRLSVASSVRSSLPSLMGEGEEGGGEDTWTQGVGCGLLINDLKEEEINWKKRYEELEIVMVKFRVEAAKVQDVLQKKLTELQSKVRNAERKAEEAERKAQVMEKKFSEIKNSASSSVPCTCNKTFFSKNNYECSNSKCVISALEQQVEEQRRLRILDAKQVEDKAAKIKEWVTNKLKELEEQNQHLREQNQKCNVQLELLKSRLTNLSELSPNPNHKNIRDRGSTEQDSSRGSFEEHGDSDDSLPPPEVLEYSSQSTMQHTCREHSLSGTDGLCYHCSSLVPQETEQKVSSPNSLYASVDYSSKKNQTFTNQAVTEPPKLKLERKKYALDGCFTPSTLSTTSDQRYSDVDCLSWNRGSSRIDSGSADIDTPNSVLSPDEPISSIVSHNAGHDIGMYSQRQSFPGSEQQALSDQNLQSLNEELGTGHQDYSQKNILGNRPLTAPSIASNLDTTDCFDCDSHKRMPDKSGLTLDELSCSLSNYKDNSCSQDELHDYAEIYTPNKDCSDFYTDNDECESVITDDLANNTGKPPTPPLHRFPSWESRIYDVANNGINVSSDISPVPANDSSNNNQSKTSNDVNSSNNTFTELNIPVYATVKGRASQIRSVPFTGDSSDSSDNEDARVTMTTTSSQTTSGDTESSASLGAGAHDSSPTDKKLFLNHRISSNPTPPPYNSPSALSKCHGSSASPMKIVRREMSNESVLSDDYAVPPDAVSVDVISINSTDNHSSVTNTPTFIRRILYSEDTQKKEVLEKSGYLTKLGGKFKTWRRRWFVLKNGMLSYYKSQTDVNRKPQGQIVLDNVCRVNRAEGAATFEISTGKRTYYLTADSISMMEEWIKVLQNVLRRNATKLLLTKDDKPAAEGWLTKVKHGHSRRCWCVLIGRMFLYFKTPNDCNPLGQINMRDARVEEVLHVSDSDEEENDHNKVTKSEYTVGIFPNHQGPTYLLMDSKQEMDSWLYHLTVVSSGDNLAGTQYEQLIAKLMEVNGEESCVVWKHPLLLYSKDPISQPLTTLPSEQLQLEAVKMFKSIQLFISVPLDTSGIEYHVALAQNSLLQCLIYPELQNELFCQLIKQTSRHSHQKIGVQQLLICATQSLFLCDSSSAEKTSSSAGSSEKPLPTESKLNPAPFVFVQAWQLLALAVSLFVPKNRTLWYLRMHLQRNANSKLEAGKYAIFCQRALERALVNGGRECKPSRMEALSILLKNPYHHSLPHSIPVHFMNGTYQVFGFDGSTTVHEFTQTVNREVGIRDCEYSGFALFSDDPIEKDLEHCLLKEAKLCDVISQWEQALRVQHLGKFENTKVLKLMYKNRLILRQNGKAETDKERLLLVYQINEEIMEGKFPLSKELAIELAALLAQIEFGDYSNDSSRITEANSKPKPQIVQVIDQFFPKKFRDAVNDKKISELIKEKWLALKGRSNLDCVRIYLNCARKWSFAGGKLFPAKFKSGSHQNVWLAIAENCIAILDTSTLQCIVRYPYSSVMTFGGCRDDFMLVISSQCSSTERNTCSTERLLFSMTKPKILEITLLIADYMNAIAQNSTSRKRCTSTIFPSPRGSFSSKFRSKVRANTSVSQNSNTSAGSMHADSSPDHGKMALS